MKKYLLIILLFIPILGFSQIDKIGFTKSQVLSSMNSAPCKSDDNSMWFCVEDGSRINYSFKYNLVNKVFYMTAFSSQVEAEDNVKNEIAKAIRNYGRPEMKQGHAYWFSGNLLISIFYGNTNGGHFSCLSISNK
jgi:hypothetical protein